MNIHCLIGKVVAPPHFHWNRLADQPPQAFMACHIRLRAPQVEGDTVARIAVYGDDAEYLYPRLSPGDLVEVTARYRVRLNPDAAAALQELIALDDKLAKLVRAAALVHEFVAYPHQIRVIPPNASPAPEVA